MKRHFVFASCAAALLIVTGCATPPPSPYGSFLAGSAPVPAEGIASDAVQRLAATWLPAKTRLALQHAMADEFGVALVASLRAQGYAVLEFTPQEKTGADAASGDASEPQVAAELVTVPVSYVLDRAGEFYRLKLLAGGQTLSRAYVVNQSQFAPAGAWSALKE